MHIIIYVLGKRYIYMYRCMCFLGCVEKEVGDGMTMEIRSLELKRIFTPLSQTE